MNVTLIPFFLAANIVVNDKSEWTFGPEYLFKLQETYEYYNESPISIIEKIIYGRKDLVLIKCRPKMSDNLFCLLEYTKYNYCGVHDAYIANFEMKFNESGVEKILTNSSRTFMKNLIQEFANQLSAGIYAHRNFNGGYVMADVNYSVDKTPRTMCQTVYSIREPKIKMAEKDAGFQFVILPMFDLKSDSNFVIRKSDADCYYHWIHTLKDKTVFEKKFSIFEIKFESWIQLMNSTFENDIKDNILPDTSKKTIQLMLMDIKRAENKSINISAYPRNFIIHFT